MSLGQSCPGGDDHLEDGVDHGTVDTVQGHAQYQQLLPKLHHPLQNWCGHLNVIKMDLDILKEGKFYYEIEMSSIKSKFLIKTDPYMRHETVLGEQDKFNLSHQIMSGVKHSLQRPDCSLQHIAVHVTPHIVLDEGLRVSDDLEDGVERLIVSTCPAPPDESCVLEQVSWTLLHLAPETTVEGTQLSVVSAPGAGAGETPMIKQ